MTERNLRNGWSNKKTIRRFLGLVLFFNVVAWFTEATGYVNRLEWELLKVAELTRIDAPIATTEYTLFQGDSLAVGLLCAVVTTVYLAVMVVFRESFKENWYVTLRRVPNYRGEYLRTKLLAVLFPTMLYTVYGSLQWAFQRSMYCLRVPETLRAGGVWRFSFTEEVLIPVANLALFAIAILLLSFVLRNVKKDIIGCIASIGGIGMMVVCKYGFGFPAGWQRVVSVSGVIGVEMLFLVRHVYRKL